MLRQILTLAALALLFACPSMEEVRQMSDAEFGRHVQRTETRFKGVGYAAVDLGGVKLEDMDKVAQAVELLAVDDVAGGIMLPVRGVLEANGVDAAYFEVALSFLDGELDSGGIYARIEPDSGLTDAERSLLETRVEALLFAVASGLWAGAIEADAQRSPAPPHETTGDPAPPG